MYKFAICDDDREFCGSFADCLRDVLGERKIDFTISAFYDTESFERSLKDGGEYDLVFLDILLKDENGIDFARTLRSKKCDFALIFITTCREYAVDSFEVSPLYYILKPVSIEKLKAAMERFLEKNAPKRICFDTRRGYLNIKIADVIYIEIINHNVVIHKKDNMTEVFRGTLREIESELPTETFLKPHRSYIVNLEHISGFSRSGIKVTGGTVIPVSRKLYDKVQLEFMAYLERKGSGA